ncbi:hypothetical protein LRP88_01657 [Fusarium phalaenopsidis]
MAGLDHLELRDVPFWSRIPPSQGRRNKLAQTTTHINTRKSLTLSLFVNVRLADCTANRIFGPVRAGGPHTAESFDELAQQLESAWDGAVNDGKKGHSGKEMKVVSIQESITAGVESGLLLPQVGGDAASSNENRPKFKQLAQARDNDFVQLLHEMQNREDLVKALSGHLGQKEALAEAITYLHADRFKTPRWYINVIFADASAQTVFVGGRRRLVNHITARVRSGPTRSRESFNELCSEINSAWHRIVHPELSASELPPRELELAAIFITSELVAGMKVGFPVPAAGTEIAWAKEHFESFKERAALGDEDFVDYVEELEKKPEFNAALRSG